MGIPAYNEGPFKYSHITTNTTTNLKTGIGILHAVTINTPGSTETITINDGAAVVAVITPTVTTSLIYDVGLINGLSVVTAGTTPGDYTIVYS